MKRLTDAEFEAACDEEFPVALEQEAKRARESEVELLNAVTAALLHLMVRPEQRLRGTDDNVREMLRLARDNARWE